MSPWKFRLVRIKKKKRNSLEMEGSNQMWKLEAPTLLHFHFFPQGCHRMLESYHLNPLLLKEFLRENGGAVFIIQQQKTQATYSRWEKSRWDCNESCFPQSKNFLLLNIYVNTKKWKPYAWDQFSSKRIHFFLWVSINRWELWPHFVILHILVQQNNIGVWNCLTLKSCEWLTETVVWFASTGLMRLWTFFVGGKGFAKVVTPSPSKNICGFRSWSNSKSLHVKCHTQGHIHTDTRLFSLILSRITLSLTFMESIDNVVCGSAKLFIKDPMQ